MLQENLSTFEPYNISSTVPRQNEYSATGLWGPKRDSLLVVVPITVCYCAIFVCGVVGNVSTCIVIARNKHMHTATNYYLFSLAVSDLLLLVSGLPQEMYHIWSNYPYVFGETFCVLTGFASETSTNATVLTITAFTVERYVAICHPFLSHTVSKLSRAVKFIIAIWLLSLCLAVPQAIQMGVVYLKDDNGNIVSEEYKSCTIKDSFIAYSFFISTVLFFLTPMTLITVLYILIGMHLNRSSQMSRRRMPQRPRTIILGSSENIIVRGCSQRHNNQHSKSTKRVVKMLVAVVVAFFICWAPFQVQRLYAIYGFAGEKTTSAAILVYKAVTYTSGLLYYLSTTINPILYNIMSLKFRQAFKSTLTKCLSGNDKLRRSGEIGGSSGGAGGGSLGPGRLNYAALSRRSSRNNNNSCSSGNSYIEPGTDLTKRPLVVSFRRRSARTSSSSLDIIPSPERRRLDYDQLAANQELIKLHELSLSGSKELLSLQIGLNSSKEIFNSQQDLNLKYCKEITTLQELTVPIRYAPSRSNISLPQIQPPPSPPLVNCVTCPVTTIVTTPTDKVLRVEDIEIFQESQLKIQRSVKRNKKHESVPSESCDWRSNNSVCDQLAESRANVNDRIVNESNCVRKSFTLPCLTLR